MAELLRAQFVSLWPNTASLPSSSPTKQDKICFCYRRISTFSKNQRQINEHNEHHLPFSLSPSALPLQLPEKGCTGTSQPPPGGGRGVGDAPCFTVLFWLTLEEDQVGHLRFCCFLLSLSGFCLEEDCTGGTPMEK